LLDKPTTYEVFVISGLHENFILGIDFIRDFGLNYCPRHREFLVEGGCPQEQVGQMKLKERYAPGF